MEPEMEKLLYDIDRRLAVVESDMSRMMGNRRILLGMAGFLVIQAIVGAIALGELRQKVSGLHLGDLERDVGAALVVVADHDTELENIRGEMFRMRGVIDQINNRLDERTKDRYYRSDALRLEDRVGRLETYVLKHGSHGE